MYCSSVGRGNPVVILLLLFCAVATLFWYARSCLEVPPHLRNPKTAPIRDDKGYFYTYDYFVVDVAKNWTFHDVRSHGPAQESDAEWRRPSKRSQFASLDLIKNLTKQNYFATKLLRQTDAWVWRSIDRKEEEKLWCQELSDSNWHRNRVLFQGHFYFSHLDFPGCEEAVALLSTVWINMVRDPADRIHSQFYYARQPQRWLKDGEKPSKAYLTKNMSECIMSQDTECDWKPGHGPDRENMVTYFCGNAPECRKLGSKAALQAAKKNVENHYAVVGFLDDFESFLQVLETMLPPFFHGAHRRYASKLGNSKPRNAGSFKKELSGEARDLLRSSLATEYELVDFLRRRFELQKIALGIQ